MAGNAATIAAVEEIKKEMDKVKEFLLKKGPDAETNDEAFFNVIQSVRDLKEWLHKWNQISMVEKSGQTSEEVSVSDEWMEDIKKQQMSLLSSLPTPSPYEDTIVMKKLLSLATRFPDILPFFGSKVSISVVLSQTSIKRSYTDDVLQCFMAALVFEIASLQDNARKILHYCPRAMSFLIPCLRSTTTETMVFAVHALCWLTSLESNSKIVVEEGGIEPLLELIQEKDSVVLPRVAMSLFNICKVVENRGRAVYEGVVIVMMKNIRRGVLVDQMLEILEKLSGNEKAIAQMEENGVVECLFGILGEKDVKEKNKEFCVSIINKMCQGDVKKTGKLMNTVENGRDTLELVVSSGTAKAKEKASELLCWLLMMI